MIATEEIKRLIDLAVRNGLAALEMTSGDTRIRIETGAAAVRADTHPAAAAGNEVPPPPKTGDGAAAAPDTVRAPTDGIVHLAPSPGAAPFVATGQLVHPGETVCIIEVMKMFFPVAAAVGGTVEAIRVADGQQVGFDEVLLVLR